MVSFIIAIFVWKWYNSKKNALTLKQQYDEMIDLQTRES